VAKGETIRADVIEGFIASAKRIVDAKGKNSWTPESQKDRLITESGAFRNGVLTDPGRTSSGATGVGQMFPPAVADAHKFLYGQTLTEEQLKKTYDEVTASPEKSILYSYALHALLEKRIRGYLKSQGIVLNDDSSIRTLCSAAYHLGQGNFKGNANTPAYEGVNSLIRQANNPPPFSITKFVELYEDTAEAIGQSNYAVRKTAGIGGSASSGSSTATVRQEETGPTDATASEYIPLTFDVSGTTPNFPQQVITEGLDNKPWFDKPGGGGLVGNPHLRQMASPAWFELRLDKSTGASLSTKAGDPLLIKLNVSLNSVSTKSQHIVNREQTATGLMLTFWGSHPDSIVGRGTTGLFLNTFGLTSYMSSKGSLDSNGLDDYLKEAFSKSPRTWAAVLQAEEKLRVAAQDAFMEFTALFKNNGVIRFLPLSQQTAGMDQAAKDQLFKGGKVWAPAAGASGFQMLNRAGDTYTRGHVAFKYKGQTYLGYFKSMTFTADAKTPYQWNFDFNFRVLRSLSPVFKYQGGK
jgi:hypothetical protein